MEIISTHRGEQNFFNELVRQVKEAGNPKGFSLHTVTLERALDDGFLAVLQAKSPPGSAVCELDEGGYFDLVRAGCSDEETFLQEYCCVPASEAAAFVTWDMITGCEYRPGEFWETDLTRATGPLYVGVDVGRTQDLTVIWVLERQGGVLLTRRLIELRGQTFAAQEAVLWPLLALPGVRRCCIDSTGLGMQFAERARERFGSYRVEPVRFSAMVKEELAYPVRRALEDRQVRLPERRELRADLRSIRKVTTAAGHIRFEGERTAQGHADRFWALALALHAAAQPGAVEFIQPMRERLRPQANDLGLRNGRRVIA